MTRFEKWNKLKTQKKGFMVDYLAVSKIHKKLMEFYGVNPNNSKGYGAKQSIK